MVVTVVTPDPSAGLRGFIAPSGARRECHAGAPKLAVSNSRSLYLRLDPQAQRKKDAERLCGREKVMGVEAFRVQSRVRWPSIRLAPQDQHSIRGL